MKRSPLLLLVTLLACTPGPAPAPRTVPGPPSAALVATATAGRVVVLSFDGLSADGLAGAMPLPGFTTLQREGTSARVVPVNPTSTASTHVSILTGAEPRTHGIVANRFHVPGTAPETVARGLDTSIDAETLVQAARRQGKRVGAVLFPTVDGRDEGRRADFGIAWTASSTWPSIVKLSRSDFRREWVPPTWTPRPTRRPSFSPVMRARLEWSVPQRMRTDVDVVAYDSTDDGAANYDSYFVEVEGEELARDADGWFAVTRQAADGLYGSWSKILRSTPALDVEVYRGAISRTNAYPDHYRAMLDAEAGFWPGVADETSDIDPATFAQQIARFAAFATRAQTVSIARMDFDLLLAYQPQVDWAAHNFLGYDDGVVRSAMEMSGRAIEAIRAGLDPARDALVVVGDHGYAPIVREVRVNRLLAELGAAPRWRAYAAGNVAHLYRSGPPDDTAGLVQQLAATGHFEKVEMRQEGWHRNAGDVVTWAAPGTVLSPSTASPVVGEPESYAQHGALNTHREMHTVLFAAGAGVPHAEPGEVPQTAIARFVSELLGIQPPAAAR